MEISPQARLYSITDDHRGFGWLYPTVEGHPMPKRGDSRSFVGWENGHIIDKQAWFLFNESPSRIFCFGVLCLNPALKPGHGGLWSSRASVLSIYVGCPCMDIQNGLAIRVSDMNDFLLANGIENLFKVVKTELAYNLVYVTPPEGAYLCGMPPVEVWHV